MWLRSLRGLLKQEGRGAGLSGTHLTLALDTVSCAWTDKVIEDGRGQC